MIYEITDKQEWEDFVSKFERRTFLNSWDWGAFRESLGDKIYRRGVVIDNKTEALFLASKVTSRKGDFLLLTHFPLSLTVQGFELILNEIKEIAQKERVSFIRIAPSFKPESLEEDLLIEAGFKLSPSSIFPLKSLELDLSLSDQEILAQMRRDARYRIRKTLEDKSARISVSDDLNLFYNLYQETAERHRFKPFSYDYLKKETEVNDTSIILGWRGDKLISGAFIVFWGGKAFYHHGASLSDSGKTSLSHLVQWAVIQEAKKRGCSRYDLWAIAPTKDKDHKWSGLTHFKKSFGGKEIDYAQTRDLPLSKRYLITYWAERIKG